jgi:hypothetical protein
MRIVNELYKDEVFETEIIEGREFKVSLTEESELSLDGGYSYEVVTNSKSLTRLQAIDLYGELASFIGYK